MLRSRLLRRGGSVALCCVSRLGCVHSATCWSMFLTPGASILATDGHLVEFDNLFHVCYLWQKTPMVRAKREA